MTDYVGTVKRIFPKTWANGGTSFSFTMEETNFFFRLGAQRYAGVVEVGNKVSFSAEQKDDKSAQVSGKVTAAAASTQAPASATPGSGGMGNRDNSIVYQSSRKDALLFIQVAIAAGALKLPAKQSTKVAVLEGLVDRYTAAYFEDVNKLGAIGRMAAFEGEEAPEAPEDGDESDNDE